MKPEIVIFANLSFSVVGLEGTTPAQVAEVQASLKAAVGDYAPTERAARPLFWAWWASFTGGNRPYNVRISDRHNRLGSTRTAVVTAFGHVIAATVDAFGRVEVYQNGSHVCSGTWHKNGFIRDADAVLVSEDASADVWASLDAALCGVVGVAA